MSDNETLVNVVTAGVDSPLVVERKPSDAEKAQDSRTESVAELLSGAYAMASKLQVTDAETKALRAQFPDSLVRGGAKGDEKLLYISHIHLSDRLTDVLGLGQWALVKRSQRAEQTKTVAGKPLTRLYYEGVLLIRGAFVTEAIGVGQYHPNNPNEDYGSGLESAMSDCLTRCCKRLGVGSQVWDKSYCDRWLKTAGGTKEPVRMPQERRQAPQEGEEREPTPEPSSGVLAKIQTLAALVPGKRFVALCQAAGIKVDEGELVELATDDKLVTLLSALKSEADKIGKAKG